MASLRILKLDTFWKIALLVVLLRALSGPTGFLAYLVIAMYGVRGRRQTVEAMLLSWYITMANPAIFGEVAGGSIGRFLVIVVLAGATLGRFKSWRVSHVAMATLTLGGYILLHSILFSTVISISFLKGAMWTLAMLTVVVSFTSMYEDQFHLTEQHVYGFLVFLLMLCVPIYLLLPGGTMLPYDYLRGVLGHSQGTGVLGALIAGWTFSRLLNHPYNAACEFFVLSLAVIVVFQSGTRTGMLSIGLCVLATGVIARTKGVRPVPRLLSQARNPAIALSITALGMVTILSSDTLMSSISDFFVKSSSSTSLAEAYSASRGELIETMLENIREDPIIGLGFGIASDPEKMKVETVAGVPVSAAIEKGVTHISVWEELGIIGLLLTIYWAVVIFSKAIAGSLGQFALLLTILLQNFGEATLFSPGGMGLLQIILIGYASHRTNNSIGGSSESSVKRLISSRGSK